MAAFASGFIPASLACVISNVRGAPVLEKAARRNIPIALVEHRGLSRQEHEQRVLDVLRTARTDHLLLAGYMRILSPEFLGRFSGRIINIHPALLPEFPGLHAARKQWEAGRQIAGATVHYVDAGVDTGPILLQGSRVAEPNESLEVYEQRLLEDVEHVIYPRAVRLFLERLHTRNLQREVSHA